MKQAEILMVSIELTGQHIDRFTNIQGQVVNPYYKYLVQDNLNIEAKDTLVKSILVPHWLTCKQICLRQKHIPKSPMEGQLLYICSKIWNFTFKIQGQGDGLGQGPMSYVTHI